MLVKLLLKIENLEGRSFDKPDDHFVKSTISQNKTVVSGCNSAIGGPRTCVVFNEFGCNFDFDPLTAAIPLKSWGNNWSRTLDGNNDDTIACERFAVVNISCCCRVTVRSYTINNKNGNNINATADTANIIGLLVVKAGYINENGKSTLKKKRKLAHFSFFKVKVSKPVTVFTYRISFRHWGRQRRYR